MMQLPGQQPGSGQDLRSAIGGQSPPINPNTPNIRTDPRETELLDLQRIRRALEKAVESSEGGLSSPLTDILRMMKTFTARVIAGVDPVEAFVVGVKQIIPPPQQQGGAPGIAAPAATAGPPGMPAPPPMGMQAPLQGPVSPGLPG